MPGITRLHWGNVGTFRRHGELGTLFALWPAPVNADACFEAAGFRDFDDAVATDDWDLDFQELLTNVLGALAARGATRDAAIRERLEEVFQDDDAAPCEITFGDPPRAVLRASDGHTIFWVWLHHSVAETWKASLPAVAAGRPVVETNLKWSALLPAEIEMFRTERLRLRNWREDDLEPFIRHTNTPAVMKYLGGVQEPAEMREKIRTRSMLWLRQHGFTFYVVERLADAEILGFCGLKRAEEGPVKGEVEIGWRLREDAWRQGYATEAATASLAHAFGPVKAKRVIALTDPKNEASWRVMEKLGMKRRADLDYDDPKFGRTIVYVIEEKDWRARSSSP